MHDASVGAAVSLTNPFLKVLEDKYGKIYYVLEYFANIAASYSAGIGTADCASHPSLPPVYFAGIGLDYVV